MSLVTIKIPDVMERPKYVNNELVGTRKVAMKRFQNVKAEWIVESLPDRHNVFNGEARGQIQVDLDPGYYVVVARYIDSSEINNFKYHHEFYHEINEDQWRELRHMRPTISKAMHTTQGVVYRCQFIGCDDRENSSRIAAVLHEAWHQGVDLLKDPDMAADVENAMSDMKESIAGKKKAVRTGRAPSRGRGPGRMGQKMDD